VHPQRKSWLRLWPELGRGGKRIGGRSRVVRGGEGFAGPMSNCFLRAWYRIVNITLLSYDALQGALVWPKVEEWKWETIFYGHCRSTFNNCDIISLQSYQIR